MRDLYEVANEVARLVVERKRLIKQLKELELSPLIARIIEKGSDFDTDRLVKMVRTDLEDELGYIHNQLLDRLERSL